MRRFMLTGVVLAALTVAVPSLPGLQAASPQEDQRAKPRPPAPPQRRAVPRPPAPPRVLPPRYHMLPRTHYFRPISTGLGFYYHPYFGFYYGPYYGPFYPYPGPYLGAELFSDASLHTKVTPDEARVYVNGYYAGEADDFDGIFQGLYLSAGEHDIEFFLDGYRTVREHLFLNAGDSRELTHRMVPVAPGETSEPPMAPRGRPVRPGTPVQGVSGDRPASPFGMLALRLEPSDAEVLIDGEAMPGFDVGPDLVIHLTAGWHKFEVRRDGYQTFRTDIELSEGATTRLNIRLVR
jgi:hypothetical protein